MCIQRPRDKTRSVLAAAAELALTPLPDEKGVQTQDDDLA